MHILVNITFKLGRCNEKSMNHIRTPVIHPLFQIKSGPETVPVRGTRFSSDTYFETEGVRSNITWFPKSVPKFNVRIVMLGRRCQQRSHYKNYKCNLKRIFLNRMHWIVVIPNKYILSSLYTSCILAFQTQASTNKLDT
jgi:hypothetical protein